MRGMNGVKAPQTETTNQRMSFGWLMILMLIVCVTYAHLIPLDVLSSNPNLNFFIQGVEIILPAIGGYAKYSSNPEVMRLYLSTLWIAFPFFSIWFTWYDFMRSKIAPPKVSGVRAIPLLFGALIFAGFMFYLLGLFEPAFAPSTNAVTGGRGNAYYAAIVGGRTSMAVLSVLNFIVLSICVNMIYVATKRLFKGGR
ncbi:hypothetical protein FQZ97_838250 [compost metagenome]